MHARFQQRYPRYRRVNLYHLNRSTPANGDGHVVAHVIWDTDNRHGRVVGKCPVAADDAQLSTAGGLGACWGYGLANRTARS